MTVCNQNRIHCERLNAYLVNCSQDGINGRVNPNCPRLETINHYACADKGQASDAHIDEGGVPSSVDTENGFLHIYMNIAERIRLIIGHDLTDMIKFCTFKGKNCLYKGWVLVLE